MQGTNLILSKCAFKCPVNRIALTEIVIWSGTFPIEDQPQNNSGKVLSNMYSQILSWGAAYLQCKSVNIFYTFLNFPHPSTTFDLYMATHSTKMVTPLLYISLLIPFQEAWNAIFVNKNHDHEMLNVDSRNLHILKISEGTGWFLSPLTSIFAAGWVREDFQSCSPPSPPPSPSLSSSLALFQARRSSQSPLCQGWAGKDSQ